MSEPPTHFRNFQQIRDRKAFDDACVISKENFEDLVGDYDFDHDVKCQVERKGTKDILCGHDHQKGYLGRRIGGKEGLIGRVCADLYFEGHKAFAAKRSFVTRELAIDDLIFRLQSIQRDGTFLSNVNALTERLRDAREKSKSLLEDLPRDIHERLRAMAKARNAILNIAVRFMEKVEDDRTGKISEVANWVTQAAGSVSGIEIVDRTEIIRLGRALGALGEAFEALDTRRELGRTRLRSQLKILESIAEYESRLLTIEKQYQSFANPENLRNLWMLSRTQASQLACLRLAAHSVGATDLKESTLRTQLQQITRSLMQANSGRDIRPEY
jgi:predicted metal-dependent hydrolase